MSQTSTFSCKQIGNKENKTIVFLHGFLEDSSIWESLANALQTDYHCLMIDLLGHGQTSILAEVSSMELMAWEVKAILSNQAIERCTLVGHSMGGYVALAFAEAYPDMVESLVLMNSTPQADTDEKKANRDRVLKVIDKEKDLFVRTAVTNLFSQHNRVAMKDALEKLVAIGIATPNEGIKAAAMGMKQRTDRTEVLKKLSAKKHIIIGENDALISATYLTDLASRVGATCTLLPGGHLSYIEDETATIQALRKFMKQ